MKIDCQSSETTLLAVSILNVDGESPSEEASAPMNRFLSAKIVTHIGYCKVLTLFTTSKLSQVIKQVEDYKLKILELCEVCWTEFRKFSLKGKMILFSVRHDGIPHDGMAIILVKSASKALTQ